MCQMERKLMDYLPVFMKEYREMEAIMDTEQVSIEKGWIDAENVLADQFIQDATENGVLRYEKILNITPKATHTLEERKFDILTRINEQLPYTMASLQKMLQALCGEGGYVLKMNSDSYELVVKLDLANQNNYDAVCSLLEKTVPANIVKNVRMYNTHMILGDFTHGQLAAYTYDEIRKEVL